MSIDSITPEPPSPISTQLKTPQSRKQKRLFRARKNAENDKLTTPHSQSSTTTTYEPTPYLPLRPPPAPAPPSPMPPTRLLIASIGNPAPYLTTLHSAGHTVLFALASALQTPLSKANSGREWAHGLVAPGPEWTLWASPVSMNISGEAVRSAWRAFLSFSGSSSGSPRPSSGRGGGGGGGDNSEEARLVVLHDELEAPLGSVKVRDGGASAKGHNGLKSIREKMPGLRYTRIGIGIGRPEGREPGVVAGYVLRKMSGLERGAIEGCVGRVEAELRRLSAGG